MVSNAADRSRSAITHTHDSYDVIVGASVALDKYIYIFFFNNTNHNQKTSKMRFTNNRLTSLQADKTLLGSIRLCRAQLNEKI